MLFKSRHAGSGVRQRLAAFTFGILMVSVSFIVTATGLEDMLDDLRWQSRVLMVFSSNAEDPRASAFLAAADAARCELLERDLVLARIQPGDESYLGDTPVSAEDAADVREKLRVDEDFHVLLIGKDGGVKANYRDVPQLEEIFRLVDGMPMRRREARERSMDCTD